MRTEYFIDSFGKEWKIVTLPDDSDGETVLVVEVVAKESKDGKSN